MLEIRTLAGEQIVLNNAEATVELYNTLFNDSGKFSGSFSYPLDVAFTGANKVLLGFANAIETSIKSTSTQVLAKIGGKDFRQCTLRVSVSEKSFECNLDIDLGIVNSYLSSTYLTDLPFETYNIGKTDMEIQTAMMSAAVNTDWKIFPYTFFPVRNYEFTGGANARQVDPVLGTDDNPVGFPNPKAEASSLINSVYRDGQSVKFNVQRVNDIPSKYHTVPFFYLPYLLSKIAEQIGFSITGDFIQHPDIAKTVIYNVNSTFISRYTQEGIPAAEKNGLFFNAGDHLPKILISDFFKALSAMCVRITPDIAKGELNISWKKSAFEFPKFVDWRNKPLKIKKMDFEVSDGYTITAEIDKIDSDKEQPVESVTVGAGKEKIDIKAGAMRVIEENLPGSDQPWKIPFDNHAGNIIDPIFLDLNNYRSIDKFVEFPLRFAINKGVDFWGGSNISYPMGSPEGSEISWRIASMNTFAIRPWYDRTYASKKVTANILLDPLDICNLKDESIILIKGENGVTVQCLFEKISFTSNKENSLMTEAELIILDSAFVKPEDNNGFFIKITEGPVVKKTGQSNADVTKLSYGVYLLAYDVDYVDLTISVWRNRDCTIPYIDSKLAVYLKTVVEESRNSFTENRNIYVGIPGTENQEQQEYFSTRRILFDTENTIVLAEQPKKIYEYWWISAWDGIADYEHNVNEKMNCSEVRIHRSNGYEIQPNQKYTVIK